MSHRPSPPPAVCANWLPLWNQPPERPRVAGVELCVISPSVANAMNVPAMLVSRTMPERSGIVLGSSGTLAMAMNPHETSEMAIRYQRLRDSV